eukprot:926855-Rhodomonas_salina.1
MSSYARVAHVELCPCCSCHGGAGCRALCAASAHDDTVRAVSPPTKSTSQVHIVCIMLVPRASESGDTSGCQCQCQCGPGQSRSLRLHATSCWRNPQAPTGHGPDALASHVSSCSGPGTGSARVTGRHGESAWLHWVGLGCEASTRRNRKLTFKLGKREFEFQVASEPGPQDQRYYLSHLPLAVTVRARSRWVSDSGHRGRLNWG